MINMETYAAQLLGQPSVSTIDFSTLSLNSLCEIYAASFGICTGWTEAGKNNLRRSLEYQREKGKVKFPVNPSKRLLSELSPTAVCH